MRLLNRYCVCSAIQKLRRKSSPYSIVSFEQTERDENLRKGRPNRHHDRRLPLK